MDARKGLSQDDKKFLAQLTVKSIALVVDIDEKDQAAVLGMVAEKNHRQTWSGVQASPDSFLA